VHPSSDLHHFPGSTSSSRIPIVSFLFSAPPRATLTVSDQSAFVVSFHPEASLFFAIASPCSAPHGLKIQSCGHSPKYPFLNRLAVSKSGGLLPVSFLSFATRYFFLRSIFSSTLPFYCFLLSRAVSLDAIRVPPLKKRQRFFQENLVAPPSVDLPFSPPTPRQAVVEFFPSTPTRMIPDVQGCVSGALSSRPSRVEYASSKALFPFFFLPDQTI